MDLGDRMTRANPSRYGVGTPGPEVWSPDLEASDAPAPTTDPNGAAP